MTRQLQAWLRKTEDRYAFLAFDADEKLWVVELRDSVFSDTVRGCGPTPRAAELDALENYAIRTFPPESRREGRKVLGLP